MAKSASDRGTPGGQTVIRQTGPHGPMGPVSGTHLVRSARQHDGSRWRRPTLPPGQHSRLPPGSRQPDHSNSGSDTRRPARPRRRSLLGPLRLPARAMTDRNLVPTDHRPDTWTAPIRHRRPDGRSHVGPPAHSTTDQRSGRRCQSDRIRHPMGRIGNARLASRWVG